eukprot:Nk52_evm61s1020 gene=Nk52_evmTU61s1020
MPEVAIIGAGASGLVCGKIFREYGIRTTVYESSSVVGGTWAYDENAERDEWGMQRAGNVHSSMYENLHTNLAKDIMAFKDFPFSARKGEEEIIRFPSRETVQDYLEKYTDHFQLKELIQFNTRVEKIQKCKCDSLGDESSKDQTEFSLFNSSSKWRLQLSKQMPIPITQWHMDDTNMGGRKECVETREREFDAVVVCNGHYTKPSWPEIDGMDIPQQHGVVSDNSRNAKGPLVFHSHWFRQATEKYKGKRVVVLGSGPSGFDIAREIGSASETTEVYLCARNNARDVYAVEDVIEEERRKENYMKENVDEGCVMKKRKSVIGECVAKGKPSWPSSLEFSNDGSRTGKLNFEDGSCLERVDVIICCTGYNYSFPFIDPVDGLVSIEESGKVVTPLFQHVFTCTDPTLAFVGLNFKVVPFPFSELQAEWIAKVYTGKVPLVHSEVLALVSKDVREKCSSVREEQEEGMKAWLVRSMQRCPYRPLYHCMAGGAQFEYFEELSSEKYAHINNHGPAIESTYYASKRLRRRLLGY